MSDPVIAIGLTVLCASGTLAHWSFSKKPFSAQTKLFCTIYGIALFTFWQPGAGPSYWGEVKENPNIQGAFSTLDFLCLSLIVFGASLFVNHKTKLHDAWIWVFHLASVFILFRLYLYSKLVN